MNEERNKQMVREAFEAASRNDLDAAVRHLHRDFVYRSPATGDARGEDGYRQMLGMYRRGWPDLRFDIRAMAAEGDKVMVSYDATGTQKGEFMGVSPTNKRTSVEVMSVLTCRDGKIAEQFVVFDTLDLLKQLDAVPAEMVG